MKTKFGMLVAGLMIATISFGVLGPRAGLAQEPAPSELEAKYFYDAAQDLPRWLPYSIVVCAAETMKVHVEHVLHGLRSGHSLAEIGIRAGVRPSHLESGILRCEHALLIRLVETGELQPEEARRIFNFLSEHITRIINYKWDPSSS